ncbi:hypothetical protein HPP92_004885 [Vanilla planifolia]|uniref:Uncharacterized protein n=1 Tax=Vanilla planifolia TaxID=51239 RepID=A0A835RSC9_VANPL|nr:hypothetical protein HPP92_004885 [Vanilla planifolia]
MPKLGRRKRAAAKCTEKPNAVATDGGDSSGQLGHRLKEFSQREVELRVAAIQAIKVAELENILSCLRMLNSYLSKEQLEMPALKYFQENLPNLRVIRNEEEKIFELRQNEKDAVGNGRASIVSTASSLQFSVESVKHRFLHAANLPIPDRVLEEMRDTQKSQMLGVRDAFQTPGAISDRLSFALTPKTVRLPKQGEMLLSVRGSPLGVYIEDSLEPIHE